MALMTNGLGGIFLPEFSVLLLHHDHGTATIAAGPARLADRASDGIFPVHRGATIVTIIIGYNEPLALGGPGHMEYA